MKNTIYRLEGSDNSALEFYVAKSNFLNPYRDKRELGIVVLKDNLQLDFDFSDEESIDELIDYLSDVKRYCSKFNENSKPEES